MKRLILFLAVLLENCFILGCFTFLACHFNHWWIVLFSALFFSSVKSKEGKKDE